MVHRSGYTRTSAYVYVIFYASLLRDEKVSSGGVRCVGSLLVGGKREMVGRTLLPPPACGHRPDVRNCGITPIAELPRFT